MVECVQCGFCCKVGICPYGEWDEAKHQCALLTEENFCKIYEDIKHDQTSPAMGTGCSSSLCNTDRQKKIEEMRLS